MQREILSYLKHILLSSVIDLLPVGLRVTQEIIIL